MSDEVRVSPTPIQRNSNDVAVELTQLYYKYNSVDGIDDIQETYARFHAIAVKMKHPDFKRYDKLITDKVTTIP